MVFPFKTSIMKGQFSLISMRYLFASILFLVSSSAFSSPSGKLFLEINGKFQIDRSDTMPYQIQVVNIETLDTNLVTMVKGKFQVHLKYEAQYLLVVHHSDTVDKRIVISTAVPIGTSGYKIKLEVDMRQDELTHKQMGILEYNGFQNRFIVRQFRANELKRRKFEFEGVYSQLLN